jgi:hypothetical protein
MILFEDILIFIGTGILIVGGILLIRDVLKN